MSTEEIRNRLLSSVRKWICIMKESSTLYGSDCTDFRMQCRKMTSAHTRAKSGYTNIYYYYIGMIRTAKTTLLGPQ